MADGDDGIDTESFLTDSESAAGISFPLASGLNVRRLATAIVGSITFAFALGVNTIVAAAVNAYTGLIDGVRQFIAGRSFLVEDQGGLGVDLVEEPGLIDVTIGAGIAAIEGAWAFSLDEFGILAFPVAVGVFVVTAFVADRGIGLIGEVLR